MNSKTFLTFLLFLAVAGSSAAAPLPSHCERDTTEIKEILASLSSDNSASLGDRIARVALSLIGKGADDYYSTDSVATLRMNVDAFTPETFVNTVLALADASRHNAANWRNFESRLGEISLRRGENGGFPSIMWYSSDWIVDNTYRGNLIELTENFDGARSTTRSLDRISRNKDKIAALADPEVYDRLKMMEMGYRTHRLPYLPKSAIDRKDIASELRNGDVLVLLNKSDGNDTYRIGFVVFENAEPRFLYFDPEKGEVTLRPENLKRYFNLVTKHFAGFRWLRFREQ